jgi:hypothetical protein
MALSKRIPATILVGVIVTLCMASKCTAAAPRNLLENGDFQESLEHWIIIGNGTNPYHPEDPGRAAFEAKDGYLEISIRNPGKSIWSVMLCQSVVFEKGCSYRVSFTAKAESRFRIISNVTQDVTWTNFSGDNEFSLSAKPSDYSFEFTMSEGGPALVQFCLGSAGVGKVFIRNVALAKVPAISSSRDTPPAR